MSLKLVEVAHSNNIHLICFPPHCTSSHMMLPCLDHLKQPGKILKEHQLQTCEKRFSKFAGKSLERIFFHSILSKAFPKVGFAYYQEKQLLLASCLRPYLILTILSKSHRRKFPIMPANLRMVKGQRLQWKWLQTALLMMW